MVLGVLAGAIAIGIGTSGEPAPQAGHRHADSPRAPASDSPAATPHWAVDQAFGAALSFLGHYELPNGRVARWDQGGDTVSEGEAYAMLLSVAIGDRRHFDAAWQWTRAHLLQPDGLMAWHWANGSITSSESATDADVDAAYALELATTRLHEPADLASAAAMAAAIAGDETVGTPRGPVLVAGPWAVGPPAYVNPSYASPWELAALAQLPGRAQGFGALAAGTRSLVGQVLGTDALPPDWVQLTSAAPADVRPLGSGSNDRYGFDAARVPIRWAASCTASERKAAASMWPVLGPAALRGRATVELGLRRGEIQERGALEVTGGARGRSGERLGCREPGRGARPLVPGRGARPRTPELLLERVGGAGPCLARDGPSRDLPELDQLTVERGTPRIDPATGWADDPPCETAVMTDDFAALVAEGAATPTEGWDFSWFDGRASEERPPWGYAALMGERMGLVASALDVETGGGEVLATAPHPPALLVATESWPPNIAVAHARLVPLGAHVVAVADEPTLPFVGDTFELVVSRHPVVILWEEIARVLRAGGTYFSQQIGAGTNRELTDFMMGPQPVNQRRSSESMRAAAEEAGLEVVDLRSCALRVEFYDVAAVVYFLRKVHWTVPDFSVQKYEERLRDMYEHIEREGSFFSTAQRVLLEVRKPV